MCAAAGKWCAEDRPRVVGRAGAVGPAGRRARGGRREDRLHRGDHLRPRGGARPVGPAGRRRQQGHPDRGRAGQALGERDGLPDRRRARADPRRPRLRDRRLAGGARRARGAGRADAARPADQPDLRGLVGDHAPAHRPRGGRRPPQGRGRRWRSTTPPSRTRPGRPPGASGFYAKWLPQLVVGKGAAPTAYAEFGALATHLRFVERSTRKLARQTFYGMPAGRRSWSTGRRSSAGSSTSGPSCSRWRRPAAGPRCCAPTTRRGALGLPAGRRVLPAEPAARRGVCSTTCGPTPTTPTCGWPRACWPATTPGSRRACSTRARAPGRGSPRGHPAPASRSRSGGAVR